MTVREYTIIVNAPRSAEAEVEAAVADGFDRTYALFVTDPWTDPLGETVLVDVDLDDEALDEDAFIEALREKVTKATGYTTSTEGERDAALEAFDSSSAGQRTVARHGNTIAADGRGSPLGLGGVAE